MNIHSERDYLDALELRPGEFAVVFVDRRAGEIGVARQPGERVCDSGPREHFRARGGGTPDDVGDIVTRVRG